MGIFKLKIFLFPFFIKSKQKLAEVDFFIFIKNCFVRKESHFPAHDTRAMYYI